MNRGEAQLMMHFMTSILENNNFRNFMISIEEMEHPSEIPESEREFLEYYLEKELNIDPPLHYHIIKATQKAMLANGTNTPTPKQIAITLMETPCRCLRVPTDDRTIDACAYILATFKVVPSCRSIEGVRMYSLLEKRYPSFEELVEMLQNHMSIQQDSDSYCEAKKMLVPTPNISKLVAIKNDQKDVFCSICQDPLSIGEDIYKLPCGDRFHASECLGEGSSIITWLKRCKRCPNCNQEICIDSAENEKGKMST